MYAGIIKEHNHFVTAHYTRNQLILDKPPVALPLCVLKCSERELAVVYSQLLIFPKIFLLICSVCGETDRDLQRISESRRRPEKKRGDIQQKLSISFEMG